MLLPLVMRMCWLLAAEEVLVFGLPEIMEAAAVGAACLFKQTLSCPLVHKLLLWEPVALLALAMGAACKASHQELVLITQSEAVVAVVVERSKWASLVDRVVVLV
jgi:hypothetical protein